MKTLSYPEFYKEIQNFQFSSHISKKKWHEQVLAQASQAFLAFFDIVL